MNLEKTIKDLYEEKEKLERVIASLEDLQRAAGSNAGCRKQRGRKSMGAAERQEVSERMKKYWAGKRKPQVVDAEGGGAPVPDPRCG